jgi:hypothetical protein
MIWLPGVLSQGGKKYVWEKYTIEKKEVISDNTTKTFPANKNIYYSYRYSIQGDYFVLDNADMARPASWMVGWYISAEESNLTEIYQVVSVTTSGTTANVTVRIHSLQAGAGTLLGTVESGDLTAYPENGEQGGYWYVLVESGSGSEPTPDPEPDPEPGVNYVGYIQTSGSQYIKSGFTPNQDTRVVCELEFAPTSSSSQYIFGSRTSASANQFGVRGTSSGYQMKYSSADGSTTSGTTSGRFTMDCNKNTFTLAGTTFTETYAKFTCPGEMYVFALYNNGVAYGFATAKLYYMKIYDNGVLVRYYKPCLDPDGVACLYDEVNAEYVYNAGSGTFAYGMAA